MTDFYSQNRCVCSTRSHGPLLCAFCLSFHFKKIDYCMCGAMGQYVPVPLLHRLLTIDKPVASPVGNQTLQ